MKHDFTEFFFHEKQNKLEFHYNLIYENEKPEVAKNLKVFWV